MSLREKAIARQEKNPIMANRTKIGIDAIIAQYPNGITITEAGILHDTNNDSDYVVCAIKEEPKFFFFGGIALFNLINDLMKDYDTEDDFNADLMHEGGLPILLEKKRSKNGRVYTSATVL